MASHQQEGIHNLTDTHNSNTQDEMLKMMNIMMRQQEEHLKQQNAVNGQPSIPNPSLSQSEFTSKSNGESKMQKLSKFEKFAPRPFKDTNDLNEAQEWLEKLEGILDNLDTEEEDRMTFTEFLLQGEARTWWKMEKEKPDGGKYSWTEFQDIF